MVGHNPNAQSRIHANMKLARKLIADNPQDVREFINRTQDLKDVIGNYHELLFQMEAFAKQVINTIKTEYHLK